MAEPRCRLPPGHRGTPVNPGRVRHKHHLSFRTAEAEYIGGAVSVGSPTAKSLHALSRASWADFDLGAYLGGLSPVQRAVIGFPSVGSGYWSAETLAGVAQRYGDAIDLAPYEVVVAAAGGGSGGGAKL